MVSSCSCFTRSNNSKIMGCCYSGESQLSNDEVVATPLEPQAPIAATSNPLVTSSITQTEQNQPPEQRETVTSRSSVPTVGDDEEESSLITYSKKSTPALQCTAPTPNLRPFDLLESVNDDATLFKVEELMGKTRGPTASPNEIRNKKRRVHKSPSPEYTEPTEATQVNSEEQLPSSFNTLMSGYQDEGVEETLRSEDVEFTDEDYGFVDISVINNQKD